MTALMTSAKPSLGVDAMPDTSVSGPREDGLWCCACGIWRTEDNGMKLCPVSHAQMQAMTSPAEGLSHLWAHGSFERAMRIWERDAPIREALEVANV